MRFAVQRESIFAEFQYVQKNPVVEIFRTVWIGDGDVDMVYAGDFGHGGFSGVG